MCNYVVVCHINSSSVIPCLSEESHVMTRLLENILPFVYSFSLVSCHVCWSSHVMSHCAAPCPPRRPRSRRGESERRLTRRPLLRSCYADVTAYCWRHVAGFVWEGTMVQCLILFLLSFLSFFSSSFDPFIPDFLAFFRLLFLTPLFFTVFLFPSFFLSEDWTEKEGSKKEI